MGCGIAELGANPCSPAGGWMALQGLSLAQMHSMGHALLYYKAD